MYIDIYSWYASFPPGGFLYAGGDSASRRATRSRLVLLPCSGAVLDYVGGNMYVFAVDLLRALGLLSVRCLHVVALWNTLLATKFWQGSSSTSTSWYHSCNFLRLRVVATSLRQLPCNCRGQACALHLALLQRSTTPLHAFAVGGSVDYSKQSLIAVVSIPQQLHIHASSSTRRVSSRWRRLNFTSGYRFALGIVSVQRLGFDQVGGNMYILAADSLQALGFLSVRALHEVALSL